MKQKLFSRNFTLVIIGQIISLFGNAAVRFALPLYLLNQTGSSALYGTVMACAFIPTILLSPIGGIIADRTNKRNVMVILDFFTAGVIWMFCMLMGNVNLVILLTVTLMLLYGIAGAYQPSVQASIPVLVHQEYFMAANSVINIVSSVSALSGPVLGGILYSAYGLKPVLWVSAVCFFCSAVMEIFIEIPHVKQMTEGSIFQVAKKDIAESIHFIRVEKPVIGKVLLVICAMNLFLSAMFIVGLPYLITEVLEFSPVQAGRLYGFTEGAVAAGGLAGGICAGIFGKWLTIRRAGSLVTVCAAGVFPMGISLALVSSDWINYALITCCGFVIMVFSTIFTVQMMSFVQVQTPDYLMGKVISVILMLATCAQPLGNAFYGILFELCSGFEFVVIFFSGGASLLTAVCMKKALS